MTAPIQHPISVADVLDRAADLIEPEGAWTQGAFARAKDGAPLLGGRCEQAVCWCMWGAVIKAGDGKHSNAIGDLLDRITGGATLSFNDAPGRTQAEVVAALRSAATAARQQGEGK